MEKIEISTTNVFEERAKEFANTKLAQRLQEKYKAKPYEERRKVLYWLSIAGSWLCNAVAVVASASFVFGFVYSLIAKVEAIPYPTAIASFAALCVLVFIEVLKRVTVPEFFKDVFQYGFKGSYYTRLVAIVALVSVSTYFSYRGGHEFVEIVLNEPTYEAPTEKTAQDIQNRYKSKIADAKKTAEIYRNSKLWRGRLSDKDAREYKKLADNVALLESQENAEIQAMENDNREARKLARADYESTKLEYKARLKKRGSGFAGFSIFGELLFILFVWFMERYDYKTATQYAVLAAEAAQNAAATQPQAQVVYQMIQPAQNEHHVPQNGQPTAPNNSVIERRPIGFYINGQKDPQNLLQQPTQATQQLETEAGNAQSNIIVYDDRYTIKHEGERTVQRYTLARVRNYQKTYTERAKRATEQGKHKVAQHNAGKVVYWQEKEKELLEKQ